jgi:hypothetical protein
MRSMPMTASLAAALLFPSLTTPAFASDGVLEINQTCAVNTGCFAGDTPGFPVLISTSGAYRLTSRLVVPSANTDGIAIFGGTGDVSIDLNQFSIVGPVLCSGFSGNPLSCTPSSGAGAGIDGSGSRGLSVKNGSVIGMGDIGIYLGERGEVTNVMVHNNATGSSSEPSPPTERTRLRATRAVR